MSASTVMQAITTLAPLIEKVAGFIDDQHDDLPNVPLVLKSEIELQRFEARRRKKASGKSPTK